MEQIRNLKLLVSNLVFTNPDTQVVLALIGCSLFISYQLGRKTNLFLGMFCALALLNGLVAANFPNYVFPYIQAGARSTVGAISSNAVIYLMATLFIFFTKNFVKTLKIICLSFLIFDILGLIYRFFFVTLPPPFSDPWLLMNNASLDASLIGIALPLIFKEFKWWGLIPAAFAMIVTKSNTGYELLILYALLSLNWKILVAAVACIPLVLKNKFLVNNGRLHIWKLSYNWWYDSVPHFLGTGLGTFGLIGPGLQIDYVLKNSLLRADQHIDIFNYMHNDWLQCGFELGLLALACIVLALISALKHSFDRRWLFSSWILFAAAACTQMPTHYVLTSLLGLYLLKETYDPKFSKS